MPLCVNLKVAIVLKDRFCVTNVQANAVVWISQAIRAAGLDDSNADVFKQYQKLD